jgi:hypothetical protein
MLPAPCFSLTEDMWPGCLCLVWFGRRQSAHPRVSSCYPPPTTCYVSQAHPAHILTLLCIFVLQGVSNLLSFSRLWAGELLLRQYGLSFSFPQCSWSSLVFLYFLWEYKHCFWKPCTNKILFLSCKNSLFRIIYRPVPPCPLTWTGGQSNFTSVQWITSPRWQYWNKGRPLPLLDLLSATTVSCPLLSPSGRTTTRVTPLLPSVYKYSHFWIVSPDDC